MMMMITLLVNYAVTEDANRAMGLFGLVLCLYLFMVAMTDLVR